MFRLDTIFETGLSKPLALSAPGNDTSECDLKYSTQRDICVQRM